MWTLYIKRDFWGEKLRIRKNWNLKRIKSKRNVGQQNFDPINFGSTNSRTKKFWVKDSYQRSYYYREVISDQVNFYCVKPHSFWVKNIKVEHKFKVIKP